MTWRPLLLACLAIFAIAGTSLPAFGDPGEGSPTVDLRVEPGFAVLPANHLKFYLHFRQPMERGEVFRYLRLVELADEGSERQEVEEPFREVELWDETFTRLTIWLHPGRQKPGVNLNVDLGPVLSPNREYRLEVSADWPTESGDRLEKPFHHRFRTTDPDKVQPSPEKWKVVVRGNRPFLLTEDKLDPVSCRSSLSVRKALTGIFIKFKAQPLIEEEEITNHESTAIELLDLEHADFEESRWLPGSYELIIDPKLEDLAGNSIARPFNLDLKSQPVFQERTEPVVIPFDIAENR